MLEVAGLWKLPDKMQVCYMESIQKGIPPPIWGAARAFYPHNFSHQKYSKKSAYPWVEKISEKICGKMFRVKESPQSCGKGAKC